MQLSEKQQKILYYIGTAALVVVFLMFGSQKFIDPATWNQNFADWGLPLWMRPVAGGLEILGAIGLLIPKIRGAAGLALGLFMIGAVLTHVVHAEYGMILVAGAIMVVAFLTGRAKLDETKAFLGAGEQSSQA